MSTGASSAAAGTSREPGAAVAVIASIAQFTVVLDGTIVNVALPSMRRALGFDAVTQQWIITSYLLVFGGLLLLGGRLADLFGRRRIFLAGLTLFSLASLLGGLAPNGGVLIAARALQGLGGALLAPAPMALIAVTYPEGPRRLWAIGLWSATAASAGIAGVVLGGLLVQLGDWRWVMFVNVPIGAVLVLAGLRHLASDAPPARQRLTHLDIPGAALVTGGVAALLFAVAGIEDVGWAAPRTLTFLVIALLLLGAFWLTETRSAHPLLRPRLIRLSGVRVGNLAMLLTGWLTSGIVLFLALVLQEAYGNEPLHAGLGLLPLAAVVALVSLRTRWVQTRLGWRATLATGALLLAVGLVWQSQFSLTGGYVGQVLLPSIVIGAGLGMLVLPSTTIATTGVAAGDAGLAAALINTSRQLGGSVGVAVLAGLASGVTATTDTAHRAALTAGYSAALLCCAALATLLAILSLSGIRTRK